MESVVVVVKPTVAFLASAFVDRETVSYRWIDMTYEPFTYQVRKNGTVHIFRGGRCVVTLGGSRATTLVSDLEGADEEYVQYLLQRATGNYKHGNERAGRTRPSSLGEDEPISDRV